MLVLFLGTKIFEVKVQDKQVLVNQMAAEIPLVLESQKLLEKLRQNKLGGIDPFGSINRLYPFLGGTEGIWMFGLLQLILKVEVTSRLKERERMYS